jgi:hypothetical protein
MFQVTLLDHIRLSFGGVVHSYKAHSELARRLTARLWQLRAAELALLAGALAAGITGIIQTDVRYVIASAVLCGFALALFTFYVAVNLESRIYAHRWCACRLWLVREKYRALLSEISSCRSCTRSPSMRRWWIGRPTRARATRSPRRPSRR